MKTSWREATEEEKRAMHRTIKAQTFTVEKQIDTIVCAMLIFCSIIALFIFKFSIALGILVEAVTICVIVILGKHAINDARKICDKDMYVCNGIIVLKYISKLSSECCYITVMVVEDGNLRSAIKDIVLSKEQFRKLNVGDNVKIVRFDGDINSENLYIL